MNKLKIYTRGYGIIFLMILVSLFWGTVVGFMAGVKAFIKEFHEYVIAQPKTQIEEIKQIIENELKNVD